MGAAERRKGAREVSHVCLEPPMPVKKVVEDEGFSPVSLTLSSVFSSGFCELLLGFLSICSHSQMRLSILVMAFQQIPVL